MKTLILLILGGSFSPLGAELVGHWLFDEGSGTTYADSSPNGNDVVLGQSSPWSTETPPTNFNNPASLSFDGVGEYVETNYAGIGGDAPRTVAFWMKAVAVNSHGIVAWGDSNTNGTKWHVRLNDNGNNGPFGAIRTETQGDFTIGTTVLTDGEWHHVASVYSGGGELGTVVHYVDGVAEAQGGDNASTQPVNTSLLGDPVTVGRRTQGLTTGYFPGQLDDVRIYDRALSAAEIAGLSAASPASDGLVMHFPMDEGTGTTIDDLGTGNNDGTFISQVPPLPSWSDDAPPHLNHSLLFANNNDLLRTDYEGVGGTASRSITFWFKTTLTGDNGIVGWGDATGTGLKWHANINSVAANGPVGALRLEIQNGRIVATTPANDGEWHHAALVFEEDADPDLTDLVFYLDGQVDPASIVASVPIDTQNSGGPFAVTLGGRLQGAAIRGFEGNLADVRIYDSGLTQAEVMDIMAGVSIGGPQLVVTSVQYEPGDPGSATLTWQSRPNASYRVEYTEDLSSPWLESVDAWASQGETTSYTVPGIAAGTPRLFFRVAEE